MVYSWAELAAQPLGAIPFLIDPYIAEEGVVLLYGKTRTGKSPLTWEIARCIGAGESFFGKPTRAGRVLYLELDTPRRLVQPRLEHLTPSPNVWWEFLPAISIFQPASQAALRTLYQQLIPDLVIVNTLRAVYSGDEKDAALPIRIYSTFQALFPRAAILFVHHDKKSAGNPEDSSDPDEAFSGHMAWFNHCQTGLHLMRYGHLNDRGSGLLRLRHSKSQVSLEAPDLILKLDENGSHLVAYSAHRLQQVLTLYQALTETPKTERVRLVAGQMGLSERQVWTYLSRLPEVTEHP